MVVVCGCRFDDMRCLTSYMPRLNILRHYMVVFKIKFVYIMYRDECVRAEHIRKRSEWRNFFFSSISSLNFQIVFFVFSGCWMCLVWMVVCLNICISFCLIANKHTLSILMTTFKCAIFAKKIKSRIKVIRISIYDWYGLFVCSNSTFNKVSVCESY